MVTWNALTLRRNGLPRSIREFERSLQLLGSLRQEGWQRSISQRSVVDHAGRPGPWFSYPAVEWLTQRLRSTDNVFEWGSGHSTLWFGARAHNVVSVEHDPDWHKLVSLHIPTNVILLLMPSEDEASRDYKSPYCTAILETTTLFDIIVIDGMQRNGCSHLACQYLNEDGIIIFDDSHRSAYADGMNHIAEEGLQRIDFTGFSAGAGTLKTTSVFGKQLKRWLSPTVPLHDIGW